MRYAPDMSHRVTRGRSRYKETNEQYLNEFQRKVYGIPAEILVAALKEAVWYVLHESDKMKYDSGNAAWHWSITGLRERDARDRHTLMQRYGHTPIGKRGDKGATKGAVVADTYKEAVHQIERLVLDNGRRAVTLFNPVDPWGPYGQRAGLDKILPEEVTAKAFAKASVAASKAMNSAQTFSYKGGSVTYQAGERI